MPPPPPNNEKTLGPAEASAGGRGTVGAKKEASEAEGAEATGGTREEKEKV